MTSDLDDSDEEEISDDHLLVSEVGDIMTTFIQLEASGTVPLWWPECDSEIGMQEDRKKRVEYMDKGGVFIHQYMDGGRRTLDSNGQEVPEDKHEEFFCGLKGLKNEPADAALSSEGVGILESDVLPSQISMKTFICHRQPEDFPGPQDDTSEKPQEPIETVPSPSLPPMALPHPAEITPQDVRAHLDQIKAAVADLNTSEHALNALT
ncbi:hypothetical protein C8J57DRAFT_1224144 [Mycena rebaudengoi]|nr:hypothetical protein C8J57DRAFT_1224144 [Mycena rebaudengoi]